MKTLKLMGMALLAACLNVGLIACSDENKDAPEPEDAFINESGSNNYFTNGMNFTSVASELTFAFDTNMDWSISVANTVNGTPWCYASTTSGGAGHYEVVVKVDENTSYDDRNVTLTIQAGMAKKTIIVTQKQKDAILLTSNKFEVDKAGGKINVEVKSNINYTVEIAETDKNWIKKSSTDTRALSTNTLTFEISPSEEYDKREGEIYVKSGEMIETVHVYQTGGGTILLTKNEYPVSDKGETIAVELKSNCEFEVKMPNVDWIKDAPATKAMSSHTLYYVISPNETYDSREAKIIYYDKNNMNVADTLVVIQVQKDALILSQKEYEVGASGGDLEIKLSTNIQYALSISQEDATWIQQVTTRSLVDETLYFKIAENKSLDTRIGSIVIEADKDKKETIKIIQAGKREDVVVLNVAKAGTLNQLVSYSQKNQIINLKLTGLLNGDDIRFIREMAGRDSNGNKTEGQLQILDLSEASIVAGGDYYYYKSSKKYYINDNTLTNYVFYQCENLSSIEIPKTVIKIGDYAFYDCKSIRYVYCDESATLSRIRKVAYVEPHLHGVSRIEHLHRAVEHLQTVSRAAFRVAVRAGIVSASVVADAHKRSPVPAVDAHRYLPRAFHAVEGVLQGVLHGNLYAHSGHEDARVHSLVHMPRDMRCHRIGLLAETHEVLNNLHFLGKCHRHLV